MSRLNPDTRKTLARANHLANQGQIEAALAEIEKGLTQTPADLHLWGQRLFYLLADPDQSQAQIDAAFLAYGSVLKALPRAVLDIDLDPHRRLKIAYLSGHFCHHALARVTSCLFRFHDPRYFEITIYANQMERDSMTDWFEAHCEHFIAVSQFSDNELARRIQDDQIDILVDLAGHSDRHRLRVFSAKAAPIQMTAGLGLIASTGLETIDYRLVDQALLPFDSPASQAETPLYLSQLLHWDPLPVIQALPLQASAFLKRGQISFGSFNRSYKLNAEVRKCWAEILKQVPGSRLVFKCMHFDKPDIRQAFIDSFADLGIAADRLDFAGQTDAVGHVAYFSEADIALDPFPYQGGLSTFEALHMGLPVIAMDFAYGSRASLSILKAIGAEDWIAHSSAEYIAKAVNLAHKPRRLIHWRQNLRQSLQQSDLINGLAFTRELESAYRRVWRHHCQGKSPHEIGQSNGAQLQASSRDSDPLPALYQEQCLEQARLDFEMGRLGQSEDICNDLLSARDPLAEVFHLKGLLAFQAQHFEAAQTWLKQAIALAPQQAAFYVNLGHVLRAAGQTKAAHDLYQQAIQLKPELSHHFQAVGIEIVK